MAPKKKEEVKVEEEAPPEEDEEPAEPEILKKCLRSGGQLYYGDVKAGYRDRAGTFVRHGLGRQVNSAVAPLGPGPNGLPAFETVVLSIFEGNWEEDQPCGHGTFKWGDGSTYEGMVAEGQMHGHGRFVWPDASTYEGGWHQGLMQGQGRFDSRFDGGRFMQGRFQRNNFLKPDGRWVDVLKHLRSNELKQIIGGNPLAAAVEAASAAAAASRTKSKRLSKEENMGGAGGLFGGPMLPIHRCDNLDSLASLMSTILVEGLVPLVLAEEDAPQAALAGLIASGAVTDPAAQCVSIRLASVMLRRDRDYQAVFFHALQSSLLSGSHLVLVFEDDDDGCALGSDEASQQAEWISRTPSPSLPLRRDLPEEWRLSAFYNNSSLPVEFFCPTLFNARGRSKLFLPEEVAASSATGHVPLAPHDHDTGSAAADEDNSPAAAELAAAAAAEAASLAACAPPATAGGCGPSGHIFELPSAAEGLSSLTSVSGLSVSHQLRSAVVAQARMPSGSEDAQVRQWVKDRYGQYAPAHRLAIVLLTAEGGGFSQSF